MSRRRRWTHHFLLYLSDLPSCVFMCPFLVTITAVQLAASPRLSHFFQFSSAAVRCEIFICVLAHVPLPHPTSSSQYHVHTIATNLSGMSSPSYVTVLSSSISADDLHNQREIEIAHDDDDKVNLLNAHSPVANSTNTKNKKKQQNNQRSRDTDDEELQLSDNGKRANGYAHISLVYGLFTHRWPLTFS